MFGNVGSAIRFFLLGVGVGLLTAPRSGEATRRLLSNRFQRVGEWWQEAGQPGSRAEGGQRPTATSSEQMVHETTKTTETGYRQRPPEA